MSISKVPDAVLLANVFPFLETPDLAKTAGISKQLQKASCLDAAWKNREPSHKGPKQENHSWKQHVTLIHDPYFQIMENAEKQQHNYVATASATGSTILVLLNEKNYSHLLLAELSRCPGFSSLETYQPFDEAAMASCESAQNRTDLAYYTSQVSLLTIVPLAIANYQWDKNQIDTPLRRRVNLVSGAALIAIGALSNLVGGDDETRAFCISAGSCFVMKGILPRQWLYPHLGKVVGTVHATGIWALSKGKSLAVGLKRKLFG
jgi:hypothetical protein